MILTTMELGYFGEKAAEDYLVEENVYVIPLFNFNDPALVQTYVEGQTMNGIYPYFAYATVTE